MKGTRRNIRYFLTLTNPLSDRQGIWGVKTEKGILLFFLKMNQRHRGSPHQEPPYWKGLEDGVESWVLVGTTTLLPRLALLLVLPLRPAPSEYPGTIHPTIEPFSIHDQCE